jgi:predicted GTPase
MTVLDDIARLARDLGDEGAVEDAIAISERAREGRYFVACVGQFKRGKSTLLNALVGSRVLPVGTLPVTSIPTVVRFGPQTEVRVRVVDEGWRTVAPAELHRYVSEEHNPGNVRRVSAVEVAVPSALLADGMCLVDTPGLGSVFTGSTTATRDFLPHIDAAIVVLGSDPPITGDELDLIADIAGRVPDLVFALNKADRAEHDEREAAQTFARTTIAKRLGRDPGPIWVVSAAYASEGRFEWDWTDFVQALERLASQSGRRLAAAAVNRGIARLRSRLLACVDERVSALTQPLERVHRRVASLERVAGDAEHAGADLAPLLAAEARRLADECARRKDAFLADLRPRAQRELAEGMRADRLRGASLRVSAMRQAQLLARREVSAWLVGEQLWAEAAYRDTTARFVNLTRAFVARLLTVEPPANADDVIDVDEGFTERSRFYFHEYETGVAPASPLRVLGDALRGLFGLRRGIERNALTFVAFLLELNATRVESDINDRVAESRRRLESQVGELLRRLAATARVALDEASRVRADGQAVIDAELRRLSELQLELERSAGAGL